MTENYYVYSGTKVEVSQPKEDGSLAEYKEFITTKNLEFDQKEYVTTLFDTVGKIFVFVREGWYIRIRYPDVICFKLTPEFIK